MRPLDRSLKHVPQYKRVLHRGSRLGELIFRASSFDPEPAGQACTGPTAGTQLAKPRVSGVA
jgi:hypothetical protein